MSGDRLTNLSDWWFDLLLRFYPADFRDEMGNAIMEAYRDRAREALSRGGVTRLARVWVSALADSLRNALGERLRPAASWRRSGNWGRDLELARRRLVRAPMFVAATIGTLTVGLGSFAVVYTAVDKVLIEPLPYRDPNDLYKVWAEVAHLNLREGYLSGPHVAGLQEAGSVIEDAAGFVCGNGAIPATAGRDAFHINMMASTANLFDLLGSRPALGRGFRPDEGGQRRPTTIVLSDGMWRRLGADPNIIGTPLRIGPDTHTVIGVMPPEFAFTCWPSQTPDVYVPFVNDLALLNPNDTNFLAVIRARRGAMPEQAHQAVAAFGGSLVAREPTKRAGLRLYAVGLQSDLVKEVRPALVALGFAGAFLLLVLTVNLASLLLARAAEREREFAVSRALGASGHAIVRASLIEGGALGLAGGVAGALVGIWGTRLLLALGPVDLPRRETIALGWDIGVVVIIVGALLGLVAAAVPAAWAARLSLVAMSSASATRGGASAGRMRRSLIVVQVALALVLLSAGGLVVRSFERLLAADPGFESEGVLTLRLSTIVFTGNGDAASFLDRTTAALRALPGVTHASATSTLPLSGGTNMNTVAFPGAPGNTGDEDRDRPLVDRVHTRAGYTETMGMRLLAGRGFEDAHRQDMREALIDQHLAQQFFPDRSPIGATLRFNDNALTIVGVVEQARLHNLHKDGRPQFFVRAEDYSSRGYWFFVMRTGRDSQSLIPEARAAIRQIEPRIPVSAMLTMNEIVAGARSRERISAVVIAGLALGALLLVAMGLFAVVSGSVSRRRGELAVRLALGATHHHVLRLVVGEGVLLVGLGVLIGMPGVYAAGGLVRGLLIDVSPWDPPTLLAVALGLGVVAIAACYVPARRVMRIDPVPLLRQE